MTLISQRFAHHTYEPLYDPNERDRRYFSRLVIVHERSQLRKYFSEIRNLEARAPHIAYP